MIFCILFVTFLYIVAGNFNDFRGVLNGAENSQTLANIEFIRVREYPKKVACSYPNKSHQPDKSRFVRVFVYCKCIVELLPTYQ